MKKQGCRWLCVWTFSWEREVKKIRMNEAPPVPTFLWNGPVWWESVPKWIFFNVCGCSTYHGTQIWFPRLQNLSKRSIYVWQPFPYNHLGWFMGTKNIGTHNAALGKKCEKQCCKWLCVYWVKIKNQSIAQTDIIFPKCIWLGVRL